MKLLKGEWTKAGIIIAAIAAAVAVASPAMAGYSISGDFEGWTGTGVAMTETFAGSGIWQVTLDPGAGRHEFKVTDGSWANSWPGSGNSWLQNGTGGNVTFTYDLNAPGGGWEPAGGGLIGLSADPGAWTAVGDWQGWDNANAGTSMLSLGGGIYELDTTIAAAGSYQYKAVNTGAWDAIGLDSRGVNAATVAFTTTDANQEVKFYVNALAGDVKVDVIAVPEPSTLALLGFGLVGALALRRRKV